ncbi:hypothetical protein IWX92DRAFT_182257 [Phyllosticta citricarpa]
MGWDGLGRAERRWRCRTRRRAGCPCSWRRPPTRGRAAPPPNSTKVQTWAALVNFADVDFFFLIFRFFCTTVPGSCIASICVLSTYSPTRCAALPPGNQFNAAGPGGATTHRHKRQLIGKLAIFVWQAVHDPSRRTEPQSSSCGVCSLFISRRQRVRNGKPIQSHCTFDDSG